MLRQNSFLLFRFEAPLLDRGQIVLQSTIANAFKALCANKAIETAHDALNRERCEKDAVYFRPGALVVPAHSCSRKVIYGDIACNFDGNSFSR